MEEGSQQAVKSNGFQTSEFLKSVPSICASSVGGGIVEAGNKSALRPDKAKKEGTLQKCET